MQEQLEKAECGLCGVFEYTTTEELANHVIAVHNSKPRVRLTKHQEDTIKFVRSKHPEITRKQLLPSNNEFNSVRLQQLRLTGHFIKEGWEDHKCGICGEIIKEYICHYYDWSEQSKPSKTRIRRDDNMVIGAEGFAKHMFDKHPEETFAKLGKLGFKVERK